MPCTAAEEGLVAGLACTEGADVVDGIVVEAGG
jgi:hypothetical protein